MFVSEAVVVVTWAPSGYGGGVGSKRLRELVKLCCFHFKQCGVIVISFTYGFL